VTVGKQVSKSFPTSVFLYGKNPVTTFVKVAFD